MFWLLYCSCLIRVLGNEWANDLVSLSYGYECANQQSECVWLSLENKKIKNQKNYKTQNQYKKVIYFYIWYDSWMICRYLVLVVRLCEWSSALGVCPSVCLGTSVCLSPSMYCYIYRPRFSVLLVWMLLLISTLVSNLTFIPCNHSLQLKLSYRC